MGMAQASPVRATMKTKASEFILGVNLTAKGIIHMYMLYITNKRELFSFNSECVVHVVMRLKEDWFIALL